MKTSEIKSIFLDMDGTFADLYGVENWLLYLQAEKTKPYRDARPLVNMKKFSRLLNNCQKKGIEINVLSCTSKNGSIEYNSRVTTTKLNWLKHHLSSVKFDHIYIIPYDMPKSVYNGGSCVLFDDELRHRNAWGKNAFDPCEMFQILEELAR